MNDQEAAAICELGLLNLRLGKWVEGLRLLHPPGIHKMPPTNPWRGECLDNKSICIHALMGIGDRFLYCRYIAWIKETWPSCHIKVCLRGYDNLIDVFGDYSKIAEFTTDRELSEDSDFTADSFYPLVMAHGTCPDNIPPDPGFLRRRILRAREEKTCTIPIPALPALKVGIVWTGNPRPMLERSIPLELLLPLADDPDITLYSFQYGTGHADIARLQAEPLLHDMAPYIQREGGSGPASVS